MSKVLNPRLKVTVNCKTLYPSISKILKNEKEIYFKNLDSDIISQ